MISASAIRSGNPNSLSAIFVASLFAVGSVTVTGQGPAQQMQPKPPLNMRATVNARQSPVQQIAINSAPAAAALSPNTKATVENDTSLPQLTQRSPRYIIQREDVLVLNFPLTPELNQMVTVEPDGYINLENAGSVQVQGLTVPELVIALKKAYAGILHDPIVDVDLKDFQKPYFTVFGQVGKPGKYELRSDTTVAEGIAVAGGLAPTAKTQVLLFHRTPDQRFEVEKLNLNDVLKGKNVNEIATLKPGDMIYVPDKFISKFRKYVPYSIDAGTYLTPNPF